MSRGRHPRSGTANVRLFYLFWFFVCAGWGYLSATFPSQHSPSWTSAAITLPAVLVISVGFLWVELQKLPPGTFALPPSLLLKPWNRPAGAALFIGMTFLFAGLWGAAMCLALVLPSPLVALHFFAIGLGSVAGCFAAHRLFPEKFSA